MPLGPFHWAVRAGPPSPHSLSRRCRRDDEDGRPWDQGHRLCCPRAGSDTWCRRGRYRWSAARSARDVSGDRRPAYPPLSPLPAKVVNMPVRRRACGCGCFDIADIEIVAPVQHDAVGLVQLGLVGRTAIAAKAGRAGADQGGDHARFRDEAHDMGIAFGDYMLPLLIETDFMRGAQHRCLGRAAVARMALLARSRDDEDSCRRRDPAASPGCCRNRPNRWSRRGRSRRHRAG